MKESLSRSARFVLAALVVAGLTLSVLAVTADWLGLGDQPGFGENQVLLLIEGLALSVVSAWLLRSQPAREWVWRSGQTLWAQAIGRSAEPEAWPRAQDAALALALAVLVTAVEIHFSQQLGLLAYPPYYDGVAYMLMAKSSFYQLGQWWLHPVSSAYAILRNVTPLWHGLMLVNFALLGEGEWQAYAVRFWPTFLMLGLVLWVVRRRTGRELAWVAALFTGLLPTLSVGLRASGWEYFTGAFAFGSHWYLADLRPDLLFAALLLWAVLPLIEHGRSLAAQTWLISGACAGLAVLSKPSATVMLLLAWGLAIGYVLILNRGRLGATLRIGLWSLAPFLVLVIPWGQAGGVRWMVNYLHGVLSAQRIYYANPHPTFLSEAGHYWKWFGLHMGPAEGWVLVGAGLTLFLIGWARKKERRDPRPLAYLGVSVALYALVSATPAKNYFLGLPYYFLLWLFSWAALASFLQGLGERHRLLTGTLAVVGSLYAGAVVFGGLYALQHWPAEQRRVGPENREATREMAADLRAGLGPHDTFMWIPAYGYPATLQYYMMDRQGQFPPHAWVDATTSPSLDQFVREVVDRCPAVLVYAEDIEEVARFHYTHPVNLPYWRAVADWVRRPESPYRLAKTYRLAATGHFTDSKGADRGGLTVQLYFRQPAGAVSAPRP